MHNQSHDENLGMAPGAEDEDDLGAFLPPPELVPGETTAGQLALALEYRLGGEEVSTWKAGDPTLPADVQACRERLDADHKDAFDAAAAAVFIVTANEEDDPRVIAYLEETVLSPDIADQRASWMLVSAVTFGVSELLDVVAESWLEAGRNVAPLAPAILASIWAGDLELAEKVLGDLEGKLPAATQAELKATLALAQDERLPEGQEDPLSKIDDLLVPEFSLRELLDDITSEDDEDEDEGEEGAEGEDEDR